MSGRYSRYIFTMAHSPKKSCRALFASANLICGIVCDACLNAILTLYFKHCVTRVVVCVNLMDEAEKDKN